MRRSAVASGKAFRTWIATTLWLTPVILLYAMHFAVSFDGSDRRATGFVHYDMPYYLANAREYQDGGSSGLLYAQPFSDNLQNASIYFQPQILLLGMMWKWTGMDPGLLFVLFGAVCAVFCVRVLQHVLSQVAPATGGARTLLELSFLWGGGLLVLAGLLGPESVPQAEGIGSVPPFQYDPANGWWFLNLGRNLVYPLESYYHLLFFGAVAALASRRFVMAFVLLLVLAASHPFTGVGGLLVFGAWAALERLYVKSAKVPLWFLAAVTTTLVAAGCYYGWFLPRDAEHRQLVSQWSLPWLVQAHTFVPAYALVGLLAMLRLRTPQRLRDFLASPFNRLLGVWLIVNFALENHELAITPVQPIHFTRGYTWSALFLIGAPWLVDEAFPWLRSRGRLVRQLTFTVAIGVFTLDNLVWFPIMSGVQKSGGGFALTRDERELFAAINDRVRAPSLFVSEDGRIAYLAAVYTPLRPYLGHRYNTTFPNQKATAQEAFFRGEDTVSALRREAWIVADKRRAHQFRRPCPVAYENATYLLCLKERE